MPKHTRRPWHAHPKPSDRPLADSAGRPSAYSLAQVTAERKGLTLHPDAMLEQCRQLQEHAMELHDGELALRTQERARRITLLAVTTVALWLSALIALLNQQ